MTPEKIRAKALQPFNLDTEWWQRPSGFPVSVSPLDIDAALAPLVEDGTLLMFILHGSKTYRLPVTK